MTAKIVFCPVANAWSKNLPPAFWEQAPKESHARRFERCGRIRMTIPLICNGFSLTVNNVFKYWHALILLQDCGRDCLTGFHRKYSCQFSTRHLNSHQTMHVIADHFYPKLPHAASPLILFSLQRNNSTTFQPIIVGTRQIKDAYKVIVLCYRLFIHTRFTELQKEENQSKKSIFQLHHIYN